jgi:hypothetical protein
MTELNDSNIKYAKRKWHKGNMYFFSAEEGVYSQGKTYYKVYLYINERKLYLECYNPSVINEVKKLKPQEKVKFWFVAESKEYKGKWYTNLKLKYIESTRLLELHKSKSEVLNGHAFDFGNGSIEF